LTSKAKPALNYCLWCLNGTANTMKFVLTNQKVSWEGNMLPVCEKHRKSVEAAKDICR